MDAAEAGSYELVQSYMEADVIPFFSSLCSAFQRYKQSGRPLDGHFRYKLLARSVRLPC
jgi:hypothetical protein